MTAGAAAGSGAATPAATPTAPAVAPPLWTADEIKAAKLHCEGVLRGVDATLAPEDPIKEGDCGSPVVYKVSAIGKGPAVEFSPPVTLTCDMVAAFDKWMKQDVQPKARALLGGSVVRIDTMSSYSCRNAYGRLKARLSEHGRANAIDVAGFSTTKDTANVLASWGLTGREIKALAAKQEAERAAAAAKAKDGGGVRSIAPPTVALPGTTIAPLPGNGAPGSSTGLGYRQPNHLGGPKGAGQPPTPLPSTAAQAGDAKQRFLRDIHASACKHFGTVLGPEANNAHKNHFHLDMAPRQRSNFCE